MIVIFSLSAAILPEYCLARVLQDSGHFVDDKRVHNRILGTGALHRGNSPTVVKGGLVVTLRFCSHIKLPF